MVWRGVAWRTQALEAMCEACPADTFGRLLILSQIIESESTDDF
jgi:hypothetical protein